MAFTDGVASVKEIDANTWQLLDPLVYKGVNQKFTVPAGFKTDFATIPKAFSWLAPPYGLYTRPAILHDYLYKTKEISFSDADGIFRRSMKELGVAFLRRWMMWAAVRAGSRLADTNPKEFALWLLVTIPGLLFVAIPSIVVLLWLCAFWLLESLTAIVLKLFRRKRVNRPRFFIGFADFSRRRMRD